MLDSVIDILKLININIERDSNITYLRLVVHILIGKKFGKLSYFNECFLFLRSMLYCSLLNAL